MTAPGHDDWSQVAQGKHRRGAGFLLRLPGRALELHLHDPGRRLATVHAYVEGVQPEIQRLIDAGVIPALPSTGSPLDGHYANASYQVELPTDEAAAWQLLDQVVRDGRPPSTPRRA